MIETCATDGCAAPVVREDSGAALSLHRWATLPPALFDLCAQLLLTGERLTIVERTCAAWRAHSLRGRGWAHALDITALPACMGWDEVCARMGGRIVQRRLLHLRCHPAVLPTHDGASNGGHDMADRGFRGVRRDVRHTVLQLKAAALDRANPAAATDTPDTTRSAAERERALFPHCQSLLLACTPSRGSGVPLADCGTGRMSQLVLRRAFPALRCLHIVFGAAAALAVHPYVSESQVADLGGDAENLAVVGPAATSAMDRRLACMSMPTLMPPRNDLRLPHMEHVAHLRVSSTILTFVHLSGALPALQSLRLSPLVRAAVGESLEVPRLTHVALSEHTRPTAWRRLIGAAKKTLHTLVDTGLSLPDLRFLAQCQALRHLHFTQHENAFKGYKYFDCFEALPSLRDVGLYYHSSDAGGRSLGGLVAALSRFAATRSQCSRITLGNLWALDEKRGAWRFARLDGGGSASGGSGGGGGGGGAHLALFDVVHPDSPRRA